jgi:hypothetical protein
LLLEQLSAFQERICSLVLGLQTTDQNKLKGDHTIHDRYNSMELKNDLGPGSELIAREKIT